MCSCVCEAHSADLFVGYFVFLSACMCVCVCEKTDTSLWEVGFYVDTFGEGSSRTAHTRFCAAQCPVVG